MIQKNLIINHLPKKYLIPQDLRFVKTLNVIIFVWLKKRIVLKMIVSSCYNV